MHIYRVQVLPCERMLKFAVDWSKKKKNGCSFLRCGEEGAAGVRDALEEGLGGGLHLQVWALVVGEGGAESNLLKNRFKSFACAGLQIQGPSHCSCCVQILFSGHARPLCHCSPVDAPQASSSSCPFPSLSPISAPSGPSWALLCPQI